MDEAIKTYAETLYEAALFDSARTAGDELLEAAKARAAVRTLPLSGPDLQRMIEILNRHVERCVFARFESYQRAFSESAHLPTDQELDSILKECRDVRTLQVQHSFKKLYDLIAANRGATTPMPTVASLEASSTHGMDRVVSLWKQWKARVRLKTLPKQETRPEKQKDAKFPVLNVSEFNTDLANLSKTASRTSPLSLLVMDVDKFKSINDCLGGGHEGGDRALMALSELLIRVAQSKGTAYRWGGDEFCVLLENHSLDEAEVVAERIRREVRDLKIDGLPDGFSTSIGVATYPESTENSLELFSISDKAMYEAKRAGGNCVTKSGTLSSGSASTVSGKAKQPKEEINRQLTAFLKEGKAIQNGITYNNQESLREKAAWEKRVEEYLTANLDDSYAVQFQIPSREANEHPRGIMLGMLPAWRELTSRMWMLSDFISKLRS